MIGCTELGYGTVTVNGWVQKAEIH